MAMIPAVVWLPFSSPRRLPLVLTLGFIASFRFMCLVCLFVCFCLFFWEPVRSLSTNLLCGQRCLWILIAFCLSVPKVPATSVSHLVFAFTFWKMFLLGIEEKVGHYFSVSSWSHPPWVPLDSVLLVRTHTLFFAPLQCERPVTGISLATSKSFSPSRVLVKSARVFSKHSSSCFMSLGFTTLLESWQSQFPLHLGKFRMPFFWYIFSLLSHATLHRHGVYGSYLGLPGVLDSSVLNVWL